MENPQSSDYLIKGLNAPLPILSKWFKHITLSDNAPKLFVDDNVASDEIGEIAGKPSKLLVVNERDILSYLKQSFYANNLVYCKQDLELDQEEIINDPTKFLVYFDTEYSNNKKVKSRKVQVAPRELEFDSKFESGNLAAAIRISGHEYDLILQNDTNTQGFIQWFFFKVKSLSKGKYTFNLINHTKPDSLFNYGMKVLMSQEQQDGTFCWKRGCTNISYTQTDYKRNSTGNSRYYYQLSFTCDLEANKTTYFTYSYPYTYQMLNHDLQQLTDKSDHISRATLCKTLGGNKVEYVTITDKATDPKLKKSVVITARVHPGESNSSFIMKGTMDYLMSDDALILRQNFVFLIVPMINVDGVIYGNYRCSLSGVDLNRTYKHPDAQIFPEIAAIKKLVDKLHNQHPCVLYLDLHGHSRAREAFIYGNTQSHNPEATRLFPYILSKTAPDYFNYKKSKFKITTDKEGTSRIAMWRQLKIPSVYTLETSLCGGNTVFPHYNLQNLMQLGKQLCQALMVYQDLQTGRESLARELVADVKNLNDADKCSDEDFMSQASASDSDPGEDTLAMNELKQVLPRSLLQALKQSRLCDLKTSETKTCYKLRRETKFYSKQHSPEKTLNVKKVKVCDSVVDISNIEGRQSEVVMSLPNQVHKQTQTNSSFNVPKTARESANDTFSFIYSRKRKPINFISSTSSSAQRNHTSQHCVTKTHMSISTQTDLLIDSMLIQSPIVYQQQPPAKFNVSKHLVSPIIKKNQHLAFDDGLNSPLNIKWSSKPSTKQSSFRAQSINQFIEGIQGKQIGSRHDRTLTQIIDPRTYYQTPPVLCLSSQHSPMSQQKANVQIVLNQNQIMLPDFVSKYRSRVAPQSAQKQILKLVHVPATACSPEKQLFMSKRNPL